MTSDHFSLTKHPTTMKLLWATLLCQYLSKCVRNRFSLSDVGRKSTQYNGGTHTKIAAFDFAAADNGTLSGQEEVPGIKVNKCEVFTRLCCAFAV